VFHISIWGLEALFGGLSPPKPLPRGDGTGVSVSISPPLLSLADMFNSEGSATQSTQTSCLLPQFLWIFTAVYRNSYFHILSNVLTK